MGFEGPPTTESGIWDFNNAWPTGRDLREQGDDHMRYIKACIVQTFANVDAFVTASDEELNFLVGVTSLVQEQLDALDTRVTDIEDAVANLGGNLDAPVGTRMVFHQAATPLGWVNAADANDAVVRCVNNNGGLISGSWIISGITGAAHVLTIAQMPQHRHGGGAHGHDIKSANDATAGGNDDSLTGVDYRNPNYIWNSGVIINYEGGNQGHSHTVSSDGTWRPRSADCLIGQKS